MKHGKFAFLLLIALILAFSYKSGLIHIKLKALFPQSAYSINAPPDPAYKGLSEVASIYNIPDEPDLVIQRIIGDRDKNGNGIKDADDYIEGARLQVEKKPRYVPDYYKGGYPPEDIAVCTDIVARAFAHAGYDLKNMIDTDIGNRIQDYPRVGGKPDPNIDYRRVRNMVPFFKKYAEVLTTEVKPKDKNNLVQWQGGDLVVFYWRGNEHIAIVSDKRTKEGVPLLIHTYGSYPKEDDRLLDWADTIAYHFRYPSSVKK